MEISPFDTIEGTLDPDDYREYGIEINDNFDSDIFVIVESEKKFDIVLQSLVSQVSWRFSYI